MARTDYYDTNGKALASFGSGAPVSRRIMKRDEYQKIKNDVAIRQKFLPAIFSSDLLGSSLTASLQSASQELDIQTDRTAFIASLVDSGVRAGTEQGAYIALQYSKAKLFYLTATPDSNSAVDFTFSVARFGDIRLVPGDHTLQIIGTVHTHYTDVAKMDVVTPEGTTRHTIAPQVSDLDRQSAKDEKIVVYAVDAHYVHRALPNGLANNKLVRTLDIMIDSLETYSRP